MRFLGAEFRCKNSPSLLADEAEGPRHLSEPESCESYTWAALPKQVTPSAHHRRFQKIAPENRSILPGPRGCRCLWPCKVLRPDLTKMFHVKHFCPIEPP